ncbi:Ww domain-containing oxidoreductase, partial [Globisporangium splendens]
MPPSSQQWSTKLMPSLVGKLVVVTGANAGLGFATTLPLVRDGAHVILACRDETRGRAAAQKIPDLLAQEDEENGNKQQHGVAEYMNLDVGNLDSIHAFAREFTAKYDRLDILVLNAGVKAVKYSTTVDGFEAQFGINHLGHFALTSLLFDTLKKSEAARVVTVSSISHHGCAVDFDNLNAAPPQYAAMDAYRRSKLCNMLFSYELDRRLKVAGITNVASVPCHPGVTESNLLPNLLENYDSVIIRGVIRFVHSLPWAQTNAMGALCILCAATDPNVVPGEYIGPHGFWEFYGYPRTVGSSKPSLSLEDATRLWKESEALTKVAFNVTK